MSESNLGYVVNVGEGNETLMIKTWDVITNGSGKLSLPVQVVSIVDIPYCHM